MIRVIVFGLLLAVYPKLLNANADLNQSVRNSLNIFLDNDSPKRGEEITFNISSTKKGILKVKCDQEISFKKIDKCKLKDSSLECNVSDNSLNLIAKANGYGLKICEFSLNNKEFHPIPIDIKREKKANITLFVSSSSDRVANLDEFDIKIDLNGSKQKSDIDNLKLWIKTVSPSNFKLIDTKDSNWTCKQSKKYLVCKIPKFEKEHNSSVLLHARSPEHEGVLSIEASLDASDEIVRKSIDVVELDFDSDHQMPLKSIKKIKTDGRLITFGDSVSSFSLANEDGDFSANILPKSKLFQSIKKSSKASLNLKEDEEVLSARLYWMGRIDRKKDPQLLHKAKRVKFWSKEDSDKKEFKSDLDSFFWKNSDDLFYYVGSTDVTDYLRKFSGGEFFVSNLASSSGFGGDGVWRVVVVTKKSSTADKNISQVELYSGFASLWNNENFSNSKLFDNDLTILLNGDLKTTYVSMFSLCSDVDYEDKFELFSGKESLYDKLDILQNRSNADINVDKIIFSSKHIDRLKISSLGDRFFIGFIGIVQKISEE